MKYSQSDQVHPFVEYDHCNKGLISKYTCSSIIKFEMYLNGGISKTFDKYQLQKFCHVSLYYHPTKKLQASTFNAISNYQHHNR